MLEIVIQGWDDLQKAVFDDVWDEKIMRYRANRIYRGAADKNWRLVPSLNRVCAHDLSLEQAVIRSFRKYGYADLAQYTGFWQLLPVAQHYGLPTRLLDWSYSPLVAAHFATEDTDAYDRDGAIWCIDATEVKKRLPKRLRKRLEEANCNIFSLGLLEEEVRDFAEMQVAGNHFVGGVHHADEGALHLFAGQAERVEQGAMGDLFKAERHFSAAHCLFPFKKSLYWTVRWRPVLKTGNG